MASVLDRFRLDGQVAVVTGGARGLGRATAEAFVDVLSAACATANVENVAEAAARATIVAAVLNVQDLSVTCAPPLSRQVSGI